MTLSRPTKFALMLPLASLLGGCEALTNAEKTPVSDLRPWRTISYSCKDTKETRQQIIAHNSVYDTLKRTKKVVYKDTCPEAKPQPKTS